MPIPTRSQSVSKRVESAIPTRKPSVRQVQSKPVQNATRDASSDQISSRGIVVEKDVKSATTQQRVLPRLNAHHNKPVSAHTRSASTANISSSTAKPQANVTSTTKPTTGTAQPNYLQRPGAPARVHTRSASSTSTTLSHGMTTRSSRLKPPGATDAQIAISKRQPVKPQDRSTPDNFEKTDVSQLRDELLQLQILHTPSSANLAAYQTTVRNTIQARADSIAEQEGEALNLEAKTRRALNASGLQEWLNDKREYSDAQKIQTLGTTLAEIDKYLHHSQFMQPLQTFDAWLCEVMLVKDNRDRNTDYNLQLLPTLGSTWVEAVSRLQHDVSVLYAILRGFGSAMEETSLHEILSKTTMYLKTILQEIDSALLIEKSVSQYDVSWKARRLEEATQALSVRSKQGPRTGIWMHGGS